MLQLFKCFSSFNLLLQQFVPCGCNNIFMVFQLLYPNVAAVAPCLLQYICFMGYFSEVDVWSPIITKRIVSCPIITIFSSYVAAVVPCCYKCFIRTLFYIVHINVAIICSKYFSSFSLLLQQLVRCGCNNMFMVFQLLHPNVSAVVPCCCNNMFMVFQLLHPNVAAVAPCCCNIYVLWCFSCFSLMLQ